MLRRPVYNTNLWLKKWMLTILQVRQKATQNTNTQSNPSRQDNPHVAGKERIEPSP